MQTIRKMYPLWKKNIISALSHEHKNCKYLPETGERVGDVIQRVETDFKMHHRSMDSEHAYIS